MSSNLARYGTYTPEAAAHDADRAAAIAAGPIMSLEVGENVLRFLPPLIGWPSPFRVTAMHYIDAVPPLEKTIVFACPRVELKQPCPACARAEVMTRSGMPNDREKAYRLQPSMRIFANVLDRKHPDLGPRVLAFGKTVQQQLNEIRKSPRRGGDFTDPTASGFDTIISREGSGKTDTRYTVAADRNSSPLAATEDEMIAIIEAQHDLESFINVVPPEELLAAWGDTNHGRPGGAAGPAVRPAMVRPAAAALPAAAPVAAAPRVGANLMGVQPVAARVAPTPADQDDFPADYGRAPSNPGGSGAPQR